MRALAGDIQCPRCYAIEAGGDLVPHDAPVPAIPLPPVRSGGTAPGTEPSPVRRSTSPRIESPLVATAPDKGEQLDKRPPLLTPEATTPCSPEADPIHHPHPLPSTPREGGTSLTSNPRTCDQPGVRDGQATLHQHTRSGSPGAHLAREDSTGKPEARLTSDDRAPVLATTTALLCTQSQPAATQYAAGLPSAYPELPEGRAALDNTAHSTAVAGGVGSAPPSKEHLRLAWERTGRLLSILLRIASAFDGATDPIRRPVLIVAAVVVPLSTLVGAVAGPISPWWKALALIVFVLVYVMYGLASLARFQDDDGTWRLSVAAANLIALARNKIFRRDLLADEYDSADPSVEAERSRARALTAVFVAATAASTLTLMELLTENTTVQDLNEIAMVAFVLTTLLWLLSLRTGRAPESDAEEAASFPQPLPPHGNRTPTDRMQVVDLVRASPPPLEDEFMHAFLTTLKRWRPRKAHLEADYQAALLRFLRRKLPGVAIREQRALKIQDGLRTRTLRVDLVVDDWLAIELKPRLAGASALQRAIGQVSIYASGWQGKGPVVLLICETRNDFMHSTIVNQLAAIAPPSGVLVVAAGRKAG